MNSHSHILQMCCAVSLLVVSAIIALAGDQKSLCEFTGFVSGPDGAGLPGAQITIRPAGNPASILVVTGGRGVYRATNLQAGTYELQAQLIGFEPLTLTDQSLSAGETRTVDFKLSIATIRELVHVIGTAPRDSLEASEARESSARDVGEALASTAGVWKVRKGGIANDIVMRGLESRDLNVLIDGQRIYGACPNYMDPPSFHADFSEVDRVEVGKGPFDVKNQGSLGGVVNIVTRNPERGLHATGNLSVGSFGFVNPSVTGSYGSRGFSALGGYSYRRSDPYVNGLGSPFTGQANYRPDSTDSDAFRAGTAWSKLSLALPGKQLVQLAYTRQGADHVLYPYLQMDAIYDDTDRVNFGYQADDISGVLRSIRIHSYFTQVRHWMTDQYRATSVGVPRFYSMGTMAGTRAIGGKAEAGLHNLTVGLEAFRREWDATTQMAASAYQIQYSIPGVETDSVGLYGEYSGALTDRLKLNLGARVDRSKAAADPSKANTSLYYAYNSTRKTAATDVYPSGAVRLTYGSVRGFEVGGGVGHTARIPDPRERFFALRRMGTDWVGNPELRPSRNTGADASFSFRHQGLYLSSTLYLDHIDDFILVRQQAKQNMVGGIMNSSARTYQNIDARFYGTEVQLVYSFMRRIFLSGDLAAVRGSQQGDLARGIPAGDLPEIPPLSSRVSARYDTGRFYGEIEGIFAGAQHRVDPSLGELPTAGYGTANLRVGGTYKHIALVVALNNLFDRAYFEHLSYQRDPFRSGVRVMEPGRSVYLNLSCRF